jgi:dGTP triphosphohydrolase
MDIADDIAYSTYDLEDAFKAGFLTPISMAAEDNSVKQKIADVVNKKMRKAYKPAVYEKEKLTIDGVNRVACTRFRRHRVRCFDGAGGGSWRDGSLRESSSLRPCA